MCASWNKDYKPDLLLGRFKKIIVKDKGSVLMRSNRKPYSTSFSTFEFEEYSAVMMSLVALDEKVPEIIKKELIKGAIYDCADKSRLDARNVIAEINRQENAYLADSEHRFYAVTTISAIHFLGLKSKRIDNLNIRFLKYLPSKFSDHVDDRYIPGWLEKNPSDYTTVIISIKSRKDIEAAELAYDGIDFLLGIWNLTANYRSSSMHLGGRRLPINKIIRGPLLTIHRANGAITSPRFWYRADYIEEVKPWRVEGDWKKLSYFEKRIRRKLNTHPYGPELHEAIIRYSRSLHSSDFESAFLHLWGLLEFLTATQTGDSRTTIRRASFLYKDVEYHRLVLQHLKSFRNRAVHAAESSYDIEHLVEQLRRYVETLLIFHLFNYSISANINDTADFLDQPTTMELVKKKITLLRRAMKYT